MRRALAVAALAFGGCAVGPWQGGGATAELVDLPTVPNGLVLTAGPAVWGGVSQQVAWTLADLLPGGVVFGGEGDLPGYGGPAALDAAWTDAVLALGPVEVGVDALGLTFAMATSLEPVSVGVSLGGQPLCEVGLGFEEGVLRGRLDLTRTKLGEVQASPVGTPTLEAPGAWIDAGDCLEPAFAPEGGKRREGAAEDALAAPLLEAVAAAAFGALLPALSEGVPRALALDATGAVTATWSGDGLGAGSLSAVVRAAEPGHPSWWQLAGDDLVVPFAVGLRAERHPCVPPGQLPPAAPSPIPAVDADAAWLLHRDIVAQAVVGLWRAGGLCLDRGTRRLAWPAADLAPAWPALAALEPGAEVTARLWPGAAPGLTWEDAAGAPPVARLSTGPWTVELMGVVDGARVRLATLVVALEVDATVAVGAQGSVWLATERVAVAASGVEAGLLAAPAPEIGEALMADLAEAVLTDGPVWWLPALPGGPARRVAAAGDYLVFATGSGEGAP